MTDTIEPRVKLDEVEQRQFAQQFKEQAKSEGVELIGSGGRPGVVVHGLTARMVPRTRAARRLRAGAS